MFKFETPILDKLNPDVLGKLDLFPVERDLVGALLELGFAGLSKGADKAWSSNAHWTFNIKKRLKELGDREGYLVFPLVGNDGRFRYQWLLDLVWVDAKPVDSDEKFDWKSTRGLELACESEWGATEEEILEDFIKLTFVRASIRLFIYTNALVQSNGQKKHPVEICKKAVPLSRGDRYLLVGFPNSEKGRIQIDAFTA